MTDEAGSRFLLFSRCRGSGGQWFAPGDSVDETGDQARVWVAGTLVPVMSFLVAAAVIACGYCCPTLSTSFEERDSSAWVPKSQLEALEGSVALGCWPLEVGS